ncbi:MAG: hypothetical protein PVH65_11190 [Chloroflexota bacterium]|jgi:small GTP-binding protein
MPRTDKNPLEISPLPLLSGADEKPVNGVRIGESPKEGLTLKRILRGHKDIVNRMAWSPDGRLLASASDDEKVLVFDVARGEKVATLDGHDASVVDLAWSPDGSALAAIDGIEEVRIWSASKWKLLESLTSLELFPEDDLDDEFADFSDAIAWSPDGTLIAAGTDEESVVVWDTELMDAIALDFPGEYVIALEWSPDGSRLAAAGEDGKLRIWDVDDDEEIKLKGHKDDVNCIAWDHRQHYLATGSDDETIRIWDARKGKLLHVLEGHTDNVADLAFSADDRLLASKGLDKKVRIWRTDEWKIVAQFKETVADEYAGLAFHPTLPRLATSGKGDVIRIWDIDVDRLLGQSEAQTVRYTTAKLVLVGDSGVGKTGLGWRLASGKYKEHSSTHGQQFWTVQELAARRQDGTECEAILWDLAGQDVYRSVHAIFLDDVALALLVFDPTKRQDSLDGVRFWLSQLAGNNELPQAALIGARVDRGEPVLSLEELDEFCREHGISGGYISTSAKEGTGLERLTSLVRAHIPWDDMAATITTSTFKRIKEYVLSLKEGDSKNTLVTPAKLRKQLEASYPYWKFSKKEMMTAVRHLQTHGYVVILTGSDGKESILLKPNVLSKLAASIVLEAGKDPHNQGSVVESKLLHGGHGFRELRKFKKRDREILLDSAVYRFVEHNICFRDTVNSKAVLIFPGEIREKRPQQNDGLTVENVSYVIRGATENLFASLVVKLGYSEDLTRTNIWRNQAQYEMGPGQICGFRQIEDRSGEIEIILYYATGIPDYVRHIFQGLFEKFLRDREHEIQVTCYPPVSCPNDHVQERAMVIKRLQLGRDDMYCPDCGQRVALPVDSRAPALGKPDRQRVAMMNAESQLRQSYEKLLTKIKGNGRELKKTPRCVTSYLVDQSEWVNKLVKDLRDAGIQVKGPDDNIKSRDFLLIAATPAYKEAWNRADKRLAAVADEVRDRLARMKESKTRVIPLLCEGDSKASLPADLNGIGSSDFTDRTCRTLGLLDLVLSLYGMENDPIAIGGRDYLAKQWADTVGRMARKTRSAAEQGEDRLPPERIKLLRLIRQNFGMADLQTICYELVEDCENLRNGTKDVFVRDLIAYHERRGRMARLRNLLLRERPEVEWPEF